MPEDVHSRDSVTQPSPPEVPSRADEHTEDTTNTPVVPADAPAPEPSSAEEGTEGVTPEPAAGQESPVQAESAETEQLSSSAEDIGEADPGTAETSEVADTNAEETNLTASPDVADRSSVTEEALSGTEEGAPEEPAQPEVATEALASEVTSGSEATEASESDEVAEDEPTAEESAEAEEEEEEEEEEELPNNKHWYVVKVQSGREDSIKEAIERKVKIEGLEEYYGQIVIPTERVTEMRHNKRVVRERKLYPGYLMAEVEYNDRILYLFRETSGVGDFVGGTATRPPPPMTAREVERMLGPQHEPREVARKPDFESGDRVKVIDGTFKEMEGEVKQILEAENKVAVEVTIFGRPVRVDLEYWQVEAS